MKKLVLLAAIMLGAVTASQAGVRLSLGFGLPLVAPAPVVVSPPAVAYSAPAPVYQYPCPPPVVYSPPYVCAPRVYSPSFYFGFGPGWHHGWGRYGCGWGYHHGWHR